MPADFPPKSSLTFTTPSGPITASGDIALEFSGAIHAGSGKITITDGITQSFTARDGSIQTRIVGASDTRVIDIGSSEVSISGNTLTINPSANLKLGLDYHVVIDAGAVLDIDNAAFTGLTHTGIFHFEPVPASSIPSLLITFGDDTGASDTDLVTNNGWQDIYVDIASGTVSATDRVEILVNGSWHTATHEEWEGQTYYYLSGETVGDLSGTGQIVARLVSATNTVRSVQTSQYVIDEVAPSWSAVGATLSLNSATDTGEVGDGATQFLNVTVDVDLHSMAGLQVGDRISIREVYEGEGTWVGPVVGTEHVVTNADLAGDGHLSFNLSFEDREDGEGEEEEGPWHSNHHSLKVVVSDLAGNRAEEGSYSSQTLELHIDREAAIFEYGETNGDLTQLSLHFNEGVSPAGFKLVKVSDNSEILLTPDMFTFSAGYSVVNIALPAALQDGAEYRLESTGILYDRAAGNITGTNPLDTFHAAYGQNAVLGAFSISNDTGRADNITNVAAQTVSGTYSGTLYGPQKIQVSIDGGSSWQDAALSGHSWSLAGVTLNPGANSVVARVSSGSSDFGQIYHTVTLDSSAPGLGSAPDLLVNFDDGTSNSDNVTSLTDIMVTALLATESGYRIGDLIEILDGSTVAGQHTLTAADFDSYGSVYNVDIALDTLALGSHSLSVRATDGAGNTITGPALPVTIAPPPAPDTTPPTATLDMGALSFDTSTGLVEARLDGDFTDTRIQFSINGGGTWLEGNQSGDYWSFISPYGPFSVLQMRVVDSAGNIGNAISGVSGSSVVTVVSEYNDSTSTSGGQSVLFTRGGDDSIALSDPFSYIDGGSGTDALVVMGNTAANASDWAGKVYNIERIDLADTSSLSVLSSAAVFGLGVTSLRIDGSAANSVNIGNLAWLATGSSGGYHSYTANNITLEIASAITLVGTPDYGA